MASLLLILGAAIYLLLRPNTLLLFHVVDWFGATDSINSIRLESSVLSVPDWLVFNLPAALWVAAYILVIDALWVDAVIRIRLLLAGVMSFVGIAAELMQGIGWVRGTFDALDLVFYALPYVMYCVILLRKDRNLWNLQVNR